MFKHVLVATDGSLLSQAAVDKAIEFARDAGARITVVTATEPFHVMATGAKQLSASRESYETHIKAEAAAYLASAENKAKAQGVECHLVQVEDEHPYKAIIDTAKRSGCDLIALGSHGRRGVSALVIGSVTNKVLTHSTIPVLVYR